ncbi:four helix bundle protein [Candidatus Uhrbacteria bacterium]|nr:four helix bundle protein [Candidatus Uhrbacteria bacterium]
MTNQSRNQNGRSAFDLEERTARFGEAVIRFSRRIPQNTVTRPIITQLVRAGTSIGANYCEADDAESKPDFRHKIGICKKESRETMYWFRMVAVAVPELREDAKVFWKEAKELNLIFAAIVRSSRVRHSTVEH